MNPILRVCVTHEGGFEVVDGAGFELCEEV